MPADNEIELRGDVARVIVTDDCAVEEGVVEPAVPDAETMSVTEMESEVDSL